ncbi:MAG: YfjI family protein [Vampirovibrionales bacterium]
MNAVQHLLDNAPIIEAEAPRPLVLQRPPAPVFPVDALPPILSDAVKAIESKTQAPIAICGQSVLAVASLVTQAYVNVETLGGGIKPCSLFCITIAESGERKSSVDSLALKPIKTYESQLRGKYEIDFSIYQDEKRAYDAQCSIILKDKQTLKQEKKQGIQSLGVPPKAPLQPIVTCEEPTFEALCKLFLLAQPAIGLFSDEGGMFLGGHSMKDDNQTGTITGLSKCWDGDTFKRIRAVEGNHTIAGKRLALHLMMQPIVAEGLLQNKLNQQQGLLARMLVIYPDSTMGHRRFKQASAESTSLLNAYSQHLLAILNMPPPTDMNHANELKPRVLKLTPEAEGLLVALHDEIEAQLGEHGDLRHISGFANKIPEHATRIAGVLTFIQNTQATELKENAVKAGIMLARYYLAEALRLNESHPDDEGIRLAKKLKAWLDDKWDEPAVSKACIQNKVPNELRNKAKLNTAFDVLVDYGWLAPLDEPMAIKGHTRQEAFKVRG